LFLGLRGRGGELPLAGHIQRFVKSTTEVPGQSLTGEKKRLRFEQEWYWSCRKQGTRLGRKDGTHEPVPELTVWMPWLRMFASLTVTLS
jgi:hypothetical protein